MIHGLKTKVTRNFIFAGGGQLLGALLLFIVNIFIARGIGPAQYGTWSFLIGIGTLIWVIIESAITPIFLREIVRNPAKILNIWPELLGYILCFGLFGYASFVAIVSLLDRSLFLKSLLLGFSIIFILLASAGITIFRAKERQEFFALCFILHKIIIFAITLLLREKLNLNTIIKIFVFADALYFLQSMGIIYLYFKLPFCLKISFNIIKTKILQGIPFSLSQVLRRFSFQLELLMGYQFLGAKYTGIFAVAFRIIQVISQTAQIACTAIFVPLLKKRNQEKNIKFIQKIIFILFFLGICSGFLNYYLSSFVIGLFGNQYLKSVNILQYFSLIFPFIFIYPFCFFYFTAKDKEKIWLILQILSFVLNFIVAIILIENYHFRGLTISKILNEFIAVTLVFIPMMFLLYHPTIKDSISIFIDRFKK